MKLIKAFIITLSALLLTGCYTQLQYSQTMKKITDRKEAEGYSYGEEQVNETVRTEAEAAQTAKEYSEYSAEGEEYVPVYYKDYQYADNWDECGCNPYNVYNFYGSPYNDWYGYDYYRPYRGYLSLSPFYHHRWRFRSHFGFGHRLYGSRFGFSISWGSPFYHSFYDPFFYDPFYYGSFGYGGYHPFAFNYYRGYGHGFYHGYYGGAGKGTVDNDRNNIRYGPRSIGTSRVRADGNRSRDAARTVSGRSTTVTNRSGVRTRSSVGTTRTRGTVTRSRSTSRNDGGTARTRSRNNVQRQDDHPDRNREAVRTRNDRARSNIIRSRTFDINRNAVERLENRSEIENRLRNRMAPGIDSDRIQQRQQRSRPTFLQRVRGFFESSGRFINNRSSSNSSINIRFPSSSTNRSSVGRSRSSSNRSSVSRSRSSSSNNSRSRGSSSSRSRSGGGSSGSDRSRGN